MTANFTFALALRTSSDDTSITPYVYPLESIQLEPLTSGTAARKIQLETSPVRRAIKALWSIGSELVTVQMIQRAMVNLNREQRRELRLSHRWMPGWLSDMIHRFGGFRELLALSQ